MKRFFASCMLALAGMVLLAPVAKAEPYLAVRTGLKCAQCHVNPTGGGLRTPFGNIYAQTQLAAQRLGPEDEPWTGMIGRFLAVGGNLRANANGVRVPHQKDTSEFAVEEARVFLDASLIPNRLSFYVDERVAPGTAQNMEANVRLWVREGSFYVKAGQMYLPFGFRFEDDNAFVRQLSGINMQTPDRGVEVGIEHGNISAQLAVSNGSGGGPETDNGKEVTASAAYVKSAWRVGASALFNNSDAGNFSGAALFSGVRLGQFSLLGELDFIKDESLGPNVRKQVATLAEVDWLARQGHNIKLTHEWFEPDRDVSNDEQTRTSLLYEYSPVQFVQFRAGVRLYDGIPQSDLQNRTQAFLQLHGFF
ncbi:MAG: hypothetical protein ABI885_21320 [Gammaproteobacteria bacterium]